MKRTILTLFALVVTIPSLWAQDLEADDSYYHIANDTLQVEATSDTMALNAQTDSVQILLGELAQIKQDLKAQEREKYIDAVWKRRNFLSIGYAIPNIKRVDGLAMAWKTDYSLSFQWGKTFYFHRKPIGGMVKFGLDCGWMRLNYTKLRLNEFNNSSISSPSNADGFDEFEHETSNYLKMIGLDLGMHKLEYEMYVGPSININPWKHLIISVYGHVGVCGGAIMENDNISLGYGFPISAGVSVSYKAISLGVEGLWSTIKYSQMSFDEESDESEMSDSEEEFDLLSMFNTEEFKLKEKGVRIYITFKF